MEYSCGIIPFRKNANGEVEFFVGHPGGQGEEWQNYWAYLKGCAKGEETWVETALREFKEESGLSLEGITKNNLFELGAIQQNKRKIAVAFALHYPNIKVEDCVSNIAEEGDSPEIDRYCWMTLEQLKDKTHPTHIGFYKQIIEMVS